MTVSRNVQPSMFPEYAPDRPTGWIMPSVFTGTNADLMAAVAPMYLTGSVLDVTYGEGKWWDRFTPDPFTFHDLHKVDGVDFRALPEADSSIDTVCFDPPYMPTAGASSPAIADPNFQHRYGIGAAAGAATSATFVEFIRAGVIEACRVARTFVLVKCMEFAGGPGPTGFTDVPDIATAAAREAGCFKHDQIVHHTGSGPGGHNIFTPKRARRHHSYLLVFTKAPA